MRDRERIRVLPYYPSLSNTITHNHLYSTHIIYYNLLTLITLSTSQHIHHITHNQSILFNIFILSTPLIGSIHYPLIAYTLYTALSLVYTYSLIPPVVLYILQ